MTAQCMVTIIAPIARAEVVRAQGLIEGLGNPAGDAIRRAIAPDVDQAFLHFASLHAVAGSDEKSAFLVLEFSADGTSNDATRKLAARLGEALRPIFALSSAWPSNGGIEAFLLAQRVEFGHRLSSHVGLAFCGTPGRSVPDIDREERLERRIAGLLSQQPAGLSPLGRLHDVRKTLAAQDEWRWALAAQPPLDAPKPAPSTADKLRVLVGPFLTTFAWPLIVLFLPLAVLLLWPEVWVWDSHPEMGWVRVLQSASQIAWLGVKVVLLVAAAILAVLVIAYLRFRRAEKTDWLSDRAPDRAELAAIFARENAPDHVQNHMLSHTVMKPGLLRQLTIRLAFFAVTQLTTLNPRRGFLGDIGTIHFARWITIPGTRDLLFFSNFGGSWESYLEDFITKAHGGLTAVWSNTMGFPRTKNLFQDGATDGERFKRFARQSMIHTPFWYCAYPRLTTTNIRNNALIRRDFAAASSEDDAVRWLARFGSLPRPIDKLETTQIQSLVFGGLGFKPHGTLVTVELSGDPAANRRWLAAIKDAIAFNDGRYAPQKALLTLAVSAAGLAKLGLPASALGTFPAAFQFGMCGEGRDRILGDIGRNAPENWWWGQDGNDVALLVYGDDAEAVDRLQAAVSGHCAAQGARISRATPLTPVDAEAQKRKEPFGFVDGVSQPAIRGTYRGLRNADPIHLVEPGEFILGYPDNRGNIPPPPLLDAHYDPDLRLPIAGKDQGFAECLAGNPRMVAHNGSFLVIRQLEQDTDLFKAYCERQAVNIAPFVADLPLDPATLPDYVGAKMIGRWQDGSSLVRFPYVSASALKGRMHKDPTLAASRPETHPVNPAATSVDAAKPPVPAGDKSPGHEPSIRPDNDFLFGTEDPQGLRCPFGAHVRRANPRDSLDPGSNEQIAITNRHRIIRVGRGYPGEVGGKPREVAGLMFMCLAGDIERQFEFIQQTWMGSTKFHGLDVETDPIVTDGAAGRCGFTVPTRAGPIALDPMQQFVTMRGGGYFFVPGKQLIDWLADGDGASIDPQ